MEIRNRTPLVAAWTVSLDKTGAEQLGIAVRGIWSVDDAGRLTLLADPPPPLLVDQCIGEPGLSSIRYEADIGSVKPSTDCALVGSAVAPNARTHQMSVTFRIGPVAKRAVVWGERQWQSGLLGWRASDPKRFDRVPLVWELALGGRDTSPANLTHHSVDLRNPYGRGFRADDSTLPRAGALLPQIEAVDGDGPAGFGLTSGEWGHRRRYAGTYDDAWRQHRCPLLPDDFDERFYCAAAPGLTTPSYLVGGEPVEVAGATPGGWLSCTLPRLTFEVSATIDSAPESMEMRLVTVTVDTDAMLLRMLWRGSIRIHGRLPRFQRLDVAASGLVS